MRLTPDDLANGIDSGAPQSEHDPDPPIHDPDRDVADPDDWDPLALTRWLELCIVPEHATDADKRLSVEELLGRGILRLRLYRGWSQRDLEAKSGVDQSTICRHETGRRANVGSRRLCAILKALGVGDVVFLPRKPASPPTALEVMLHGDPWQWAIDEAERRVNRRRSA